MGLSAAPARRVTLGAVRGGITAAASVVLRSCHKTKQSTSNLSGTPLLEIELWWRLRRALTHNEACRVATDLRDRGAVRVSAVDGAVGVIVHTIEALAAALGARVLGLPGVAAAAAAAVVGRPAVARAHVRDDARHERHELRRAGWGLAREDGHHCGLDVCGELTGAHCGYGARGGLHRARRSQLRRVSHPRHAAASAASRAHAARGAIGIVAVDCAVAVVVLVVAALAAALGGWVVRRTGC